MKRELTVLAHKLEGKAGKKIDLTKLWHYISGKEKPSHEALNRLALLAGFQSWDDFHEALHGEDDGQLNYEVDEKV